MSKPKYTLKDLKRLPTVEKALEWPQKKFEVFAKGVLEHSENCYKFILPNKVRDWCKYLGCTKLGTPCLWTPSPLEEVESTVTSIPSFLLNGSTFQTSTKSTGLPLAVPLSQVGFNGTCYDDYLCDPAWIGGLQHTVLGICGLLLCLLGVLGYLLCIPAFNVSGNRSGTTLYMTGIAIADVLYMVLQSIIVVPYCFPAEFFDQVRQYGRFSGYLIPYGLPLMELSEHLVVWLIVALSFDRHLYLKHGFYSKTMCSGSVASKVIIGAFISLSIYTIPKFFEFHVVDHPWEPGLIRVLFTQIGRNETYQNLMTHWLKVPIEMFLPILFVAVFTILVIAKLIDTHSARMKKAAAAAVPALIFREPSEKEVREAKESSNTMIAMWFGIAALVVKIPKFVLHILITEKYVVRQKLIIFELSVRFLDVIFAACKPFFCLYMGRHFCQAIGAMFCCRTMTRQSANDSAPANRPEMIELKTGIDCVDAERQPLGEDTTTPGAGEDRKDDVEAPANV